MIRFMNLNTAFLAMTLLVAYGTYHVKYDAQRSLKQIRTIDRQIDQERQRMRTLAADWTMLNEPARLQRLANRHLALVPVEAAQVASLTDLKTRLPNVAVASAKDDDTRAAQAPETVAAVQVPGLIKQARLDLDRQPVILRR